LVSLHRLGLRARELFEAKLARARSGRSQYLRIKGLALTGTDDADRITAGRQLLQRVIEEHPNDGHAVCSAHYALGDSLTRDRRYAEAERLLCACLALEPIVHVFHYTELRLAEVMIQDDATSSLDEAWQLLQTAGSSRGVLFRNTAWRIEIACARLFTREGDRSAAATHAQNALALLSHNEPQFSRYTGLRLAELLALRWKHFHWTDRSPRDQRDAPRH
jgi:hypothetical protein